MRPLLTVGRDASVNDSTCVVAPVTGGGKEVVALVDVDVGSVAGIDVESSGVFVTAELFGPLQLATSVDPRSRARTTAPEHHLRTFRIPHQ